MVRTKADGALRVAAGGKAPKKNASRVAASMPSPSASEKGGKDHLPGNRACPRETPVWQKKITFFYDHNATPSKSSENSGQGRSSSDNSKDKSNQSERNDTVAETSSTQVEYRNNVEMEEENSSDLESPKVVESESMETD